MPDRASIIVKRNIDFSGDLNFTLRLLLAASPPITYVSAHLGHVNPSTTLRYDARWIPNKGRRWVDMLDRGHQHRRRGG